MFQIQGSVLEPCSFFVKIEFIGLTCAIYSGNMYVMKQIFKTLCFIFIGGLLPMFAYAYTSKNTATLRVMDKAAGKTTTLDAAVDIPVQIEKLSILVRACKQSDPFDAENFYAFVEITKSNNEKIYSNWMNRNNPGDNPLQNADYDVWLVECK